MKYDVIIIGAGPAGLTAGLYSARNGLKVGIVSKDIGGTANSISSLENWPGFKGTGANLMKNFYEQVKEYDVDFIIENVLDIIKKKDFIIKTEKSEIEAKSIIIATGTSRKKLNLENEEALNGKGVSYCVTCDAFFFKNKIVGVIGGGDCAVTSALTLSDIAEKVYLIYRGEKLRCEKINEKKLNGRNNVEVFYNSLPKKLIGKEKLEAIKIKQDKEDKEIALDGLFIEAGSTPVNEFAKDLGIDLGKEKYIIVNNKMETSVQGILAAGDVTDSFLKQVVVASAEGAISAKSAYKYIKN